MNHTAKLMIAIGLAAVAAFLNFIVISQRTKPVKFAAMKTSASAGETLTTDMIDFVEVPAQFSEQLKRSVVPWNEMAVLSGKTLLRDVERGELLFWQDAPISGPRYDLRKGETAVFLDVSNSPVSTIAVGESVSFRIGTQTGESDLEWVGPFRVVTVGDKRVPGERLERVNEISVAISSDQTDRRNEKLQDYIDRRAKGEVPPIQIRIHQGQ